MPGPNNKSALVPQISIASTITPDRANLLYILMNSVKAHKKPTTFIHYNVIVPFIASSRGQEYYREFFHDLEDNTFMVHVIDANPWFNKLGRLEGNPIMYLRCLFPEIFHYMIQVLYLDADVLCYNDGIEELWNVDMIDEYAAVVPDPAIMYTDRYKPERDNTGLSRYFNSGVMLFNLAYIRQTGMDKQLERWCEEWDYSKLKCIHHDQTLMNWLFKDKLKWLPISYNNPILTAWGYKIQSYELQAANDGYPYPMATLKDTLFLHFLDHPKPWFKQLQYPEATYPYMKESRAIWQEAVAKYGKPVMEKATDNTIYIASTATSDRIDKVGVLLNSIKKNKKEDTKIVYYLFVPEVSVEYFTEYLSRLNSDSFHIWVKDVDGFFKNKVDPRGTIRNHLYYAKCLFPQVFADLDKILFLDVDMVSVGPGIEDLWNEPVEDYWVGACLDPTWQYCAYFRHDIVNTGTDHYFNAGMMLMNLKQLRVDGKDAELAYWCLNWDSNKLLCHCFDQTLLNYLLKDKVKLLNTKYNNSVLASLGIAKASYTRYMKEQGYDNPLDSLKDAVLVHFCGSKKPWVFSALQCDTNEYPYKEEAVKLWKELDAKYSLEPKEEAPIVLSVKDVSMYCTTSQTPLMYVYDG